MEGLLGIDPTAAGNQSSDPFAGACSEKAAVSKADAEADRERDRQAVLDAAAEAERVAEAQAKAEQTEAALVGKDAGELEAAQLEAFEAYQAKALELDALDAPSDEDKLELEELRRQYEATKTAKANIVREGLSKELWEARDANGLEGLRSIIREASWAQLGLAKIAEEFPRDVETANLLGAAETNMLLLRDELIVMAQSTEVSVREAEGISEIAESARNEEAYNRIYAQALPIARAGDYSTLDIFFSAIKAQLDEAEKKYNYAIE